MIVTLKNEKTKATISLDGKNKTEIKKHLKELLKGHPALPKTGWEIVPDLEE